jgi:two-component system response regulator YesN
MLKVLLVDDEPVVLKALKVLINWDELGYSVCGEAKDGKTALQMILQQNPDVVVTDIRMPAMDGLALIQQCNMQARRRVRFIILSGYDDFQYAQRAIKFGVAEYLLKPVDENALMDALMRLQIHLEQENQKEQLLWENKRSSILNKLRALYSSSRKPDDSLIASIYEGLDIDHAVNLRCVLLKKIHFTERINSSRPSDVYCAISDYLEKNYRFFVVDEGETHSGLLYLYDDQTPEQISAFFSLLQKELEKIFGINTAFIIGMPGKGIEELQKSRDSAILLETNFYFYEQRNVMLYEEYRNLNCDYNVSDIMKTDAIEKCIEQGDFTGISALLDEAFESMKRRQESIDAVKIFLNNIVIEIIRLINDLLGDYNILIKTYSAYINSLETMTMGDVKEKTLRLCFKAINYIKVLKKQNAKGIINDVERYTLQNYMKEINLKIISDKLHISTAYLGQLFKKKTGKNYNDYLNEIRIEAAKKYLATSNLKIYEIAEKVGFTNTDYFTYKFQKIEKISPSEYRVHVDCI